MTRSDLRRIIKEELRRAKRKQLDENVGGVVSHGPINRNYVGYSNGIERYTVSDAQKDFGGGSGKSAEGTLNELFEYMTEVEDALNNAGRGKDANKVGKVRRALMSATT